ncbi:MAG: nucleotide exchange factor GrpE [Thiotrichaceae bacterium]
MNDKRDEDLIDPQDAVNKAADLEQNEAVEDSEQAEKSPLELELEEAKGKADENWDKFVRLQAEMNNLRRRNEKQVDDAHKFAVKKFAESLLPVADSLEMGMAAEGDVGQIREGMDLTLKVLLDALNKHKVEVVNPVGEAFNPDYHQAISMLPGDGQKDNDVISVMQKGYTLNGRLIRPAMVVVCKN